MTEIENMRHADPMHSTLHQRGSFSHYLARRLGKELSMGCERAPLRIVEKYALNAEEQYQALRFFYACRFRKEGKHEEVKRMGAHTYRPLTDDEKEKIIQLNLAGASLSQIASELKRYPSTIHYFLKRTQGDIQ